MLWGAGASSTFGALCERLPSGRTNHAVSWPTTVVPTTVVPSTGGLTEVHEGDEHHERSEQDSPADKIKNAAQDLTGKTKESAGKVTDNEVLQAEGEADQNRADAKKAGENIKDVFNN